ncbi:MAG: PQQ-binding-like beta-propeller repeat protein [Hyphomicrobium sp.]
MWSIPERFSVWSGALATAGGVVFYGTLEGYLKAVDARTGRELYRFKTPSGIVGNPITYEHKGRGSTLRCCRASADGPGSGLRQAFRTRTTARARSASTRP